MRWLHAGVFNPKESRGRMTKLLRIYSELSNDPCGTMVQSTDLINVKRVHNQQSDVIWPLKEA